MNYKVVTVEDNGTKFYIVQNENSHPVSERFKNKSQALRVCADFINGKLQESVETAALPAPEPVTESELSHRAVGLFMASDGCWTVATIPYDPKTGAVGKVQTDRAGTNRLEGDDAFKVKSIKEVLKRA